MENHDTLDKKYNIVKLLGLGGFSRVYLVTNINDNNQYAARIRKDKQNEQNAKDNFEHELQMTTELSGLNNPNIIHLVDHGVGELNIGDVKNNVNYMILEYCPKGDLFSYINLGRLIEKHAKYIFKKIITGVQVLHEAGYCHRSLKLENILLDQNFNLKINNFIFATQFQQNKQPIILKESVGNLHYSSPQILVNQPYNGEKNDIFSLGIILFNLVTGKFGFSKAHINDPYYKYILTEKINKYWASLPNEITNINYSNEFKDLYISMISFNENKRPNISQIMNHHWFDEINNLDNEQLKQLELEVKNEFIKRWDQVNQNLNDINNNNKNSDIKIFKL